MMQFGELVAHVGGLTTEVSALRRTLRRQSFFSRKENVEAWLERLPRKAKLEVGCAQGIGFRARSIHALDNLFKVCFPTPPPHFHNRPYWEWCRAFRLRMGGKLLWI